MSVTSQWWIRHSSLNTASIRFHPLQDGFALGGQTTEAIAQVPLSEGGNLLAIKVQLSAAPGAGGSGKSYRFQISINNSASTTLDVTISETATSGSATATIAGSAGDLVCVKVTPTGTPAAANAQISIEFDPTTASHYTYPCIYGEGQVKGTAGAYNRLLFGTNADKTTEDLAHSTRDIAPFDGTITAFYLNFSVAPGVGKSWDVAIMINGVEVAASVLNVAGAATTGHLTGLSISVAAGDLLTFELKAANGTPPNTRIMWAVTFVPTVTGLFAIGGAASTSRTTGVFYTELGTLANENATEANVQLIVAPTTLYARALYAAVGAAPGSGKSWTFQHRVNTANGNLAATLSNTTAGNDTGHTDNLVAGDLIDVQLSLGGASPTATSGEAWGLAVSTAPAVAATSRSFGVIVG